MTRRPPRADPEEPDDPDALRADEPELEPEALRELLVPELLDRLLPVDARPLLPFPLLELLRPPVELRPPLALIPPRLLLPDPPLLRLAMLILR